MPEDELSDDGMWRWSGHEWVPNAKPLRKAGAKTGAVANPRYWHRLLTRAQNSDNTARSVFRTLFSLQFIGIILLGYFTYQRGPTIFDSIVLIIGFVQLLVTLMFYHMWSTIQMHLLLQSELGIEAHLLSQQTKGPL